jgi:quercetin 2,3-dioxygenase
VLYGKVEHGDSMGNKGIIKPGDVQWMTAGSGIIHQEMPKGGQDKLMWGFQLWANLPASHKMMPPRYRDVKQAQIPETELASGVRIRIISGSVNGVSGPVSDIVTNPEYMDVHMPPGTTFKHEVENGHTVLAYVFEGAAYFDNQRDAYAYEIVGANYFDFKRECLIAAENLVLYEHEGGEIAVQTGDKPVRFLLASGKPIAEPVAWYGPIVMNTEEELKVAFDEFQRGTFIKK